MSQYELTFLLNQKEEEKTISDLINSLGGTIATTKDWGEKKLAYPIKKNTSAHFYIWTFQMEPKNMGSLKQKLHFNEKIIRYLLLSVD